MGLWMSDARSLRKNARSPILPQTVNRSSFLLSILALLTAFLLVQAFFAKEIILESFSALEQQEMAQNLNRFREILANEVQQVSTIAGDWAGWDDAYQFAQDGNSTFIRTNLDESIFPQLRLNLVVFLDASANVLFDKAFDLEKNQETYFPFGLQRYLRPGGLLQFHASAESSVSGVLSLPEGLLLVASHPILKSDFTGPSMGTLVMGRFLTRRELARIARTVNLRLELARVDEQPLHEDFRRAGTSLLNGDALFFDTQGQRRISVYGLVDDLQGQPAFFLRIIGPRLIYQQGFKTITYFMLWSATLALVMGGVSHVLVNRLGFAQRQSRNVEARYRSIIEKASEGIVLLDENSHQIIECNQAFCCFLGYDEDYLLGKNFLELIKAAEGDTTQEISNTLWGKRELTFAHRDGTDLYAEVSSTLIPHNGQHCIALIIHDISERHALEKQLIFQANHDPLTHLPNRSLFNDRLKQGLAEAIRKKSRMPVTFIDLDNFKLVNDNLGHQVGDRLLVAVAERFKSFCRESDTLARIGGDEFVHLCTGCARPEDVIQVARKFQDTLREPFQIGMERIYVTATVGIAQYPEDGDSAEELIRKADTALYHAKSRGKNNFEFYNEEMNRVLKWRTAIEAHLRQALERHEFALHYQPKVSFTDGRITGLEALLRWNSPELGQIEPSVFIPVAEETGLILPISVWVLHQAARQVRHWMDLGYAPLQVAVNISARYFSHGSIGETIRGVLEQTGIDPALLELELTETILMHNVQESIERMRELKNLGIKISVDDFGTGYSSLSYISQFPIDKMKIDRSFIAGLNKDPAKEAIVRTIIVMAHSLGLEVVAEGIETSGQMEFVRRLGCEELQGYYFSPPVCGEEFEKLLKNSPFSPAIGSRLEPHGTSLPSATS